MSWFKATVDTSQRAAIKDTLDTLGREVSTGDASAFFEPLVKRQDALAGYFRELFDVRGDGGSASGDSWKTISLGWERYKVRHGFDRRIGRFTQELFLSLTTPGATGNISDVEQRSARFGTSVEHAEFFAEKRYIIRDGDGAYAKNYLVDGPGRAAYNAAVADYKAHVLSVVNQQTEENRFSRILK